MRLDGQMAEDTLEAMQRFRGEQGPAFLELTLPIEGGSETALEVLLYLAVTVYQVVALRRLTRRPVVVPCLEEERIARCVRKRIATVGSFLGGRQARGLTLGEALESLVERFDLPQLPLLGHVTEALLVAWEAGDLTREEVEACFVRLLAFIDGLDQVVKS